MWASNSSRMTMATIVLIVMFSFLKGPLSQSESERKIKKTETQADLETPEAYNERAFEYRKEGQFRNAISDYTHALALSDTNAQAYLYRGDSYKQLQDYKAAIADFSRYIELTPKDPAGWNNRGLVYLQRKKYSEARGDFQKALTLDMRLKEVRVNLALVSAAEDKISDAERELKEVIAVDSHYAPAHYYLGNLALEQKEYVAAMDLYKAALENQVIFPEAWNNLGVAYQRQEMCTQANHSFFQACQQGYTTACANHCE